MISWTEVDTLLFKRPCMTHPCYHVFTQNVHTKWCLVESEKTGNLWWRPLDCGQNFLQAQEYVIHHPIERPVVSFFMFWYHTFSVSPYTDKIMLLWRKTFHFRNKVSANTLSSFHMLNISFTLCFVKLAVVLATWTIIIWRTLYLPLDLM